MSMALQVNGVGKAYRTYKRELHRILSWFGIRVTPKSETWVLEDISFDVLACLLYTSPSPRDLSTSRMPSSA